VESIPEPTHLVYLGLGGFCAIYEVEGQMLGIDLFSAHATLAANIKSNMPLPQEYKGGREEIAESKPEALGSSGYKQLEDMHVWVGNETGKTYYCGPCTGVSIGDYYRNRTDRPKYDDLYDNEVMYDWLYDLMEADFWTGAVMPWDFGPGFVEMTEECGYENPTVFGYDHDGFVLPGDYWSTVDDIDHGWPSGLLDTFDWHWRGIKGYWYDASDRIIICTDTHYTYDVWYDWFWGPGIDTVCIFPEDIAGVTGQVRCDILPWVTVEIFKDGELMNSTISNKDGYYELTAPETGTYKVVASESEFRDESQNIYIDDLEEVYELDFLAETGLVPNAPGTPYVVECIHYWLHPELGCVLSTPKLVAVINAWLFPIEGKGAEGGKIQPLSGISVYRLMFSSVYRGQTFPVWVRFIAPADEFNAIALTDFAPEGWDVTVDATWSTPDANAVKATDNKAEIIWFGPYDENTRFSGVYKVTVPEDATLGVYTFGDGLLRYYVGEAGPYTSEIGGVSQVEVVG